MADVSAIAKAIRAAYPQLSNPQCRALARQIGTILTQAIAGGRNLDDIQIVVRRGKTSPLGNALRQLREDRRMTQGEVAKELEWSLSKVMRIEAGAVSVSVTDLKALLGAYNVDREVATRLLPLARRPKRA